MNTSINPCKTQHEISTLAESVLIKYGLSEECAGMTDTEKIEYFRAEYFQSFHELKEFSAACYEQNRIEDLLDLEPDAVDMRGWNIDAKEWVASVLLARRALIGREIAGVVGEASDRWFE